MGATYRGSLPDDDPRHRSAGRNFLMGKNWRRRATRPATNSFRKPQRRRNVDRQAFQTGESRARGRNVSGAIKEVMRRIVLAVVIAMLPTCVAVAQQSGPPLKNSPKLTTPRPVSGNPCAKHGAGFVKIEGSDTCVKIGGSVSVEASGSARR